MKRARALELLLEDPGFTSLQIAEKLNVSRVSVTKYLKALKEKGLSPELAQIGRDTGESTNSKNAPAAITMITAGHHPCSQV